MKGLIGFIAVLASVLSLGPRRLRVGTVTIATKGIEISSPGGAHRDCTVGMIVYAGDRVAVPAKGRLTIQQRNGILNEVPVGQTTVSRIPNAAEVGTEVEIKQFAKIAAKSKAGFLYPGPIAVIANPFMIRPAGMAREAEVTLSDGVESKTFAVKPDEASCYSDTRLGAWVETRRSKGSTWFTYRFKGDRRDQRFSVVAEDEKELVADLSKADAEPDEFSRLLARSYSLARAGQYTLAAHELALLESLGPDPKVRVVLDSWIAQGYWPKRSVGSP